MTNGILSSTETKLPTREKQCCKALSEFSLLTGKDQLPKEEEKESLFDVLSEKDSVPSSQKEEEEEQEPTPVALPLDGKVSIPTAPLATTETRIAPAHLTGEIQALFEKMASSLILTHASGDTETLLHLDAPQFSSSLFYGTKITIKEFSTAPKAFTIEIATNPAALKQIDFHKASLLSAFRQGDFGFSVARLDTHLEEDLPLFHRKEKVSGEDEEGS